MALPAAAALPASALGFVVPPLNATDAGVAGGRRLDHRVFTAGQQPLSRSWTRPTYLPPEKRFSLLGLGLCPLTTPPTPSSSSSPPSAAAAPPAGARPRPPPRLWQPRLKESGLLACLARCLAEPRCGAASFSRRRGECVLRQQGCAAAELTPHTSYATFLYAEDEEARVAVGERRRIPVARGEEEGHDVLRVYASSSPRVRVLLDAFISSLRLAGEPAELWLHNVSSDDTMTNAAEEDPFRPWPTTTQDFVEMRRRDRRKVNSVVRAVWEASGAGARHVVVSDIDIQVFPGWSELVRGCADVAQLCLMQQEGLFGERRKPFNSGFLAFRADSVSMDLVLDLAAFYERQFLTEEATLTANYKIEQDVLSDFLAGPGLGLWAMFNPYLVRIFVDPTPSDFGRLKVQHACGSAAGNRLLGLYRARRLYYSLAPLCVAEGEVGPQHPCCRLACWTPSVYQADTRQPPPWVQGAIFGQIPAKLSCDFSADEEVLEYWLWMCQEERNDRMAAWMGANPEEDFLEGRY